MDVEATLVEIPDVGVAWIADEPMERCSYGLVDDDGGVWFIDPLDWQPGIDAALALGEPVGVLQLLDRHGRDGEVIAKRLGIPYIRLSDPPSERTEPLPAHFPFEPIGIVARRGWREVALWWPARRTLVVAEVIGTGPAYAVGKGRAGVHPVARLKPPRNLRLLRAVDPEILLVGHGHPLVAGAGPELTLALDRIRRDLPAFIRYIPAMFISGR